MRETLILGLAALMAFIAGAELCGETRTQTVRLPGSTDTVTVTREKLDTVWRERVRWRERVTTDTVLLADTLFRTRVDTVAVLRPRWYLDSASVATTLGDTSYFRLTWLAGDSSAIQRRDAVERHVTLGPLRQLATDSLGLHVDYGEFPSPEDACGFFCKRQHELMGAAGGLLLYLILAP